MRTKSNSRLMLLSSSPSICARTAGRALAAEDIGGSRKMLGHCGRVRSTRAAIHIREPIDVASTGPFRNACVDEFRVGHALAAHDAAERAAHDRTPDRIAHRAGDRFAEAA